MCKQRGPKLTITHQICLDLLFKDYSLQQTQPFPEIKKSTNLTHELI